MKAFSRLMVGLIMAQALAAGFCLVAPQMHRATASESARLASEASFHCKETLLATKTQHTGHSGVCEHCSLPDELTTSKITISDLAVVLPVVAVLADIRMDEKRSFIDSATPMSMVPDRSASLLYTTSQRIRI